MPEPLMLRVYKASLGEFLSFLDGVQHPHSSKLTHERLLLIQGSFLNMQAFHDEAPAAESGLYFTIVLISPRISEPFRISYQGSS
jgi:hypothetical protein